MLVLRWDFLRGISGIECLKELDAVRSGDSIHVPHVRGRQCERNSTSLNGSTFTLAYGVVPLESKKQK